MLPQLRAKVLSDLGLPVLHGGMSGVLRTINTLKYEPNGFVDMFPRIFLNEKYFISIPVWLKFVPQYPIGNKP